MKNSFENSNNQNMKKTVEIENDSNFLTSSRLFQNLNKYIQKKPALTGFAIATATDEPGNPDKTSLVVMRTFVENSDRANLDLQIGGAEEFVSITLVIWQLLTS